MDDLKKMIYGKQDYYLDFLSKLVGFDTSVIRHGEDGQEGADVYGRVPGTPWLRGRYI